jgi:alpha-tubulin suppressor-like RCC1 family protein
VGYEIACAAALSGTTYCWGQFAPGLPDDMWSESPGIPVEVFTAPPLGSISAGNRHACGETLSGAVVCWGRNPFGQLGDGSQADRQTPGAVAFSEPLEDPTAHAPNHSCALTAGGAGVCWGLNSEGQLGDGTSDIRRLPVAVAADLRFRTIKVGFVHTCAVTDEGEVYCWGNGAAGQLGTGERTASPVPVPAADPKAMILPEVPTAPTARVGGAR